ncbi:mannose-1-phosphate guanylyltransferase [Spirochaeta africana]|uniref:Mannose-1-phosphate guanylyltransferase n=1 Tax=Spirochaeta africana (strain ATCC 700263 / DSM 8902 / Z-7692) TaxID=889378 RepID=H9UGY4_SPIAZ|nr:mannose-1-phosphate guanylyltransferase [Spirochaeta africana]AFG36777.1 mannose-1-phosphate guanylyltransferase [Spirochaeta africana DSM 8902]
MVDNVLILAGGSGTRLWPASTRTRPKQFMELGDGVSLLAKAVERARCACPHGKVVVVTHHSQVDQTAEVLISEAPGSGAVVLPEPMARNTAPAITAGLRYLESRSEAGITLVLPADHLITPLEEFADDMERGAALARDGNLVTFGIKPTRPETGYGYIEAGAPVLQGRAVRNFCEKPDRKTAEEYVEAGTYLWNSGMFMFDSAVFLQELEKLQPEILQGLPADPELFPQHGEEVPIIGDQGALEHRYAHLPNISVDYAVMEKSELCTVVEARFRWNDVGSWDEVAVIAPELHDRTWNPEGDTPVIQIGSGENFVFADQPVALIGVSDLHIVQKNGMLLIARKGQAQKVKDVVEQLRSDGAVDFT